MPLSKDVTPDPFLLGTFIGSVVVICCQMLVRAVTGEEQEPEAPIEQQTQVIKLNL